MIDADPNPLPLRLFARARRIRGTHSRVSIPAATLAAVRAEAMRDVTFGRSSASTAKRPRTSRAAPPDDEGQRHRELARLLARRGRMAALIRGVREPARHGALRTAILQLDANIIALRRVLAGNV